MLAIGDIDGALGIFDDLEDADLEARAQASMLLDGEGMGDQIRVLVQAKGIDAGSVLDLSLLGARSGP